VSTAIPFDPQGFGIFYLNSLHNPNVGLWLAEQDGKVLGVAGVLLYPMYFSPSNLVAQELWWWLEPEARGTGAGGKMHEMIESWALENGASALFMIALEDDNSSKMANLYARKGYKPMERTFIKEVA
ncbi:MAG: GNAT family N-acetyltransferase, partial [Synechococcus sp.]|nr:GNAT family N-acetyltransferase [Synechococcus sp.]